MTPTERTHTSVPRIDIRTTLITADWRSADLEQWLLDEHEANDGSIAWADADDEARQFPSVLDVALTLHRIARAAGPYAAEVYAGALWVRPGPVEQPVNVLMLETRRALAATWPTEVARHYNFLTGPIVTVCWRRP